MVLSENMFPFELSDWQKKALSGLEDGDQILVTAPTGSGKTLPAEFAIRYFAEQGNRIIYTSPIKALSNQKYFEFQEKFSDISFGILTGDIKDNPDAQVLIMTTEILCNYLHNYKTPAPLDFQMDLESDLACVIFDEVHYINDPNRGSVWEESMMLMPKHVQMVLLSATLAHPQGFVDWLNALNPEKNVVHCSTDVRAVPLTHYLWYAMPEQTIMKKIKEPGQQNMLTESCNALHKIADKDGVYEDAYHRIRRVKQVMTKIQYRSRRNYVLNQLVRMLRTEEKLPAICFVYSRKNVEYFAREISHHLLDPEQLSNVAAECRHILTKFPNKDEFMALPEYQSLVVLIEKGIGIHHSGMLPVLRELVEMMFTRGYIRLLFATETFAVGLNMPTKCVIFTDVKKFSGKAQGMRILEPHEYTQQAGRAGRRGFDKVGHVIHATNLFEMPALVDYRHMLHGSAQKLQSKFKMSYDLFLNLIQQGQSPEQIGEFITKSNMQNELETHVQNIWRSIEKNKTEISALQNNIAGGQITADTMKLILETESNIQNGFYKNKQRKNKERELESMKAEFKPHVLENERVWHKELYQLQEDKTYWEGELSSSKNYVTYNIHSFMDHLSNHGFLESNTTLSEKGIIASMIKEAPGVVMADMLYATNYFADYSPLDIMALFSCFTNIRVQEDMRISNPSKKHYPLAAKIPGLMELHLIEEEEYHFDAMDEIQKWAGLTTEEECRRFLAEIYENKGIFMGEFNKAVLKIITMKNELEKICQRLEGPTLDLLKKLESFAPMLIKFACSSQSLYL
jgi:antiviral helicase SKI2